MKKSMIAIFAGLMSAATFAASPDDVVLAFSTRGPDKYADNSTVVNGEYYAVVWMAEGVEAANVVIDSNGNAVGDNSIVVLKAPLAAEGKCPGVVFNLPGDYTVGGKTVAEMKGSGTWGVFLLDTRVFSTYTDTDGVEKILTGADGNPIVQSVGGSTVRWCGLAGTAANFGAGTAAGNVSAASASSTGSPLKISDIKFVGDNVHIYVTGTLPTLAYQLASGDEPSPESGLKPVQMQYGNTDGENGEMLIVTPKVPGAQFFQVNRK